MKKTVRIASVKRTATERVSYATYTKDVTFADWTLSNGVTVSIMRHVVTIYNGDVYKSIVLMPIRGINKSYSEVALALNTVKKAAQVSFPGWDINIQL